jgi:hypothetical protein
MIYWSFAMMTVGVMIALAAGSVVAQFTAYVPDSPAWKPSDAEIAKAMHEAPVPTVNFFSKGDPSVQALTYTPLYRSDFYPSFETFTENKVFQYEPKSKVLYFVRNNRTFDQTTGALTGGQVRVVYSTDMGATWNETEVYNRRGSVWAMPNFAVVNPDNSNQPTDHQFGILVFTYDEINGWARTSQAGIFKTSGAPFDFPMDGPDLGNTRAFTWNYGDMAASDADAPTIHFAGVLGNGGGGQYGTYGQWGFDFLVEDFTASSIPTQWDVNQFRNPGTPNSSYNNGARLVADAEGRLFMIVNNFFADDQENRVPAVSISEDLGSTWSAFNRMPVSVLTAYQTTHSWPNIFVYSPYDMESAVATGLNKFSYFFRVAASNQNSLTNLDLVEAKFDNGTWSLTRVAELNGIPLEFARQDSISNLQGQNAWIPRYSPNSLGHEIEVTRAADGGGILVKWIDENPARRIALGKTQEAWRYVQVNPGQYQWVSFEFDTMTATDVYVAYKNTGANAWSAPRNITDDNDYDHGTRIPPVIESLSLVPMLSLKTIRKSEYNPQYPFLPAIQQIPDIMLDAHVDYRTPNTVQYSHFNPLITSVNEEENYPFRFNGVTPNPAQDNAEVVFTTDNGAMVSVDVYTTTGSHVMSILQGYLDAGIHGVTVDATRLSSGTYYVTLSAGGLRTSRSMVIVK